MCVTHGFVAHGRKGYVSIAGMCFFRVRLVIRRRGGYPVFGVRHGESCRVLHENARLPAGRVRWSVGKVY